MEQARKLQGPFYFILPFCFQVRPQGIEQIPGVGVPLAAQFLNQRQEFGDQLWVYAASEGREEIPSGRRTGLYRKGALDSMPVPIEGVERFAVRRRGIGQAA